MLPKQAVEKNVANELAKLPGENSLKQEVDSGEGQKAQQEKRNRRKSRREAEAVK